MRNKVADLEEIVKDLLLDYLVISETKLDESFPNFQFKLSGYGVRKARRDRHKNGGRLLNLLGKAVCAKDRINMNLIIVSVLSLQFQSKRWSVSVYIGLHLRKILKHSLKK